MKILMLNKNGLWTKNEEIVNHTGCLVKDTKEDDLHLYENCLKDIKGNLHSIRDMQESMEVHHNESIVPEEEDKEQLLSKWFTII